MLYVQTMVCRKNRTIWYVPLVQRLRKNCLLYHIAAMHLYSFILMFSYICIIFACWAFMNLTLATVTFTTRTVFHEVTWLAFVTLLHNFTLHSIPTCCINSITYLSNHNQYIFDNILIIHISACFHESHHQQIKFLGQNIFDNVAFH